MPPLIALLCVPQLLAAPVPADGEKPKPRPKLVVSARLEADVNGVLWTPDGKHLILRCGDGKARVVRRDLLTADEPEVKPTTEFALPDGGFHLALAPGGTDLYSVVPAKRFNSESRLLVWDLKRVLEAKEVAKPDRAVTLEPDTPYQGALSADGKNLLTHTLEPRRAQPNPNAAAGGGWNPGFGGWDGGRPQNPEYTARFVRLNARTGDVTDEIAVFDDPQVKYAAHAVDPKANRLFVHLHTADETVIRCLDATTGKQTWERKLEQKPSPRGQHELLVSPDGGLVGVVQSVLQAVPAPQPAGGGGGGARGGFGGPAGGQPRMNYTQRSLPVLLTAKTGETAVEVPADEIQSASLHTFSADGRLLVGSVSKDNNSSQVVVWDTKTGKVVKAWSGRWRNDMHLAFAPTGYELVAAEVESTPVYGPQTAIPSHMSQNGQQWQSHREVIRTEYKATLGVWDLSPLVK
jgi:hypothetical protein